MIACLVTSQLDALGLIDQLQRYFLLGSQKETDKPLCATATSPASLTKGVQQVSAAKFK